MDFASVLTTVAVYASPVQKVDKQVGVAEAGLDTEGTVVGLELDAVDFLVAVGQPTVEELVAVVA